MTTRRGDMIACNTIGSTPFAHVAGIANHQVKQCFFTYAAFAYAGLALTQCNVMRARRHRFRLVESDCTQVENFFHKLSFATLAEAPIDQKRANQ
jgi:hypothetical protein